MESLTLEPGEVEIFFELLHGVKVVSGLGSGDGSKQKNCALALERIAYLLKHDVVLPKVSWDKDLIADLEATEHDAQVAFETRISGIEAGAQESRDIKQTLASMATLETNMTRYLEWLEDPRVNADTDWRDDRKRELDEELTNALETMSTLHKRIKK